MSGQTPAPAGPVGRGRPRSLAGRALLAAALLLPVAELVVAIGVGRVIGAPLTLLALLAISVAGGYVLRHAGVRAAHALRTPSPSAADLREAGDAAWLMTGGVLLLVPGFLTGAAGALLALPTRRVLRPLLGRTVLTLATRLVAAPGVTVFTGTRFGPGFGPGFGGDRVIRGDVVEPGASGPEDGGGGHDGGDDGGDDGPRRPLDPGPQPR